MTQDLRVLIVDDDTQYAESAAELLADSGHTTWVAESGKQALDIADTHQPEVVLMDIELGGPDGFDVAREMRKIKSMQFATLVAVTGWNTPGDTLMARHSGFDHYLTKPVDMAQIETILARVAAEKTLAAARN